ncbi:MAG: proton-translocating NADH-quinone oxidoreductase subunit L [Planctomycetaceae bacterium]|nr:proton-translocating NADH-quinone oxidoreductase subunit L [Planctomycetaceae bacterium]
MDAANLIPTLLGTAVILPLVSFFVILRYGPKMGKAGEYAAYVATGAIGSAAVLSFFSLVVWLTQHMPEAGHAAAQSNEPRTAFVNSDGTVPVALLSEAGEDHASQGHASDAPHYTGEFNLPALGPWVLGQFGDLRLSISYYIDALTVTMFCMVSFIATLIHIYAMGYMHEELHDVTDHEVTMSDGEHLHRPGRYPRFFQYLSLFCFSMLGLVVAGNIAMVFVFWELVGICSYFLIGFYVERHSATAAANKAFIVNRVGDFGMIIGLLALWSGLGTFSFGDIEYKHNGEERHMDGIFTLVADAQEDHHGHRTMQAPEGMVRLAAADEIADLVEANQQPVDEIGNSGFDVVAAVESGIDDETVKTWRESGLGYGLLVVAGLGIFCGCVGKSAQFPLHVWLPDAMEGPTPVSALVHSATMVAAGVYLVGRFFPVFTPEVLLVIAVVGVITLFMAATIAITATDIKRVLAYSTVSQLGYMMMALGVGGWVAGLMHLITHAFFKSLLFMGSGSVIHAVHTNEMPEMGGLRKKMPVTAYTMLVGCLAIAGAGVPFMMILFGHFPEGLGFSGFYSKDRILEQAFSFMQSNDHAFAGIFFLAAAGGAAITAFYMFRMWYLTFAGEPRNEERYDHAHESPPTMYAPLVILAVMAVTVAWSPLQGLVGGLIAAVAFFVGRQMFRSKASNDHGHSAHHADTSHGDGEHGHDDDHGHSAFPPWIGDLPWALSAVVLGVALIWQFGGALQNVTLVGLLEQARPASTVATADGVWLDGWKWPNEHVAHEPANVYSIVVPVSLIAIGTAFTGFLLATVMYGLGYLDPAEVRNQFKTVYTFLLNKWWFDELYDFCLIRPTHWISGIVSGIDRNWIDRLIDGSAALVRSFSIFWAWLADKMVVDTIVDAVAARTYALGLSLRSVQTGRLRQYVMFIVIGAVAIFVLISFFWNPTIAG